MKRKEREGETGSKGKEGEKEKGGGIILPHVQCKSVIEVRRTFRGVRGTPGDLTWLKDFLTSK